MLGLALDAAIEALASAPQPPSSGVVRAKPLEWQEDGPGEWCDRHHGFHITQDDQEPEENRFTASWGEGDPEWFPTLEEAQAWCQEAIDRYVREWAVSAPRSAPVGVESLAARIGVRYSQNERCKIGVPFYAFTAKELAKFAAALAQQPAAVDGAMAGFLRESVALLPPDDFKNDDAHLVICIEALLSLDKTGTLRPHGIGGQARSLLAAAAHRLARSLVAQPGGVESPPC